MHIHFVGCGSAFNKEDGQSNILVTSNTGKNMLVDCGSYFWLSSPVTPADIDALYVSHLHADHVGGIEELAFCTYFNPSADRPKLYANPNVMKELWEDTLKGGLASIQGKVVTLTEYFDCCPVENSSSFVWEGIKCTPVQTVHVMAGYHIKYSYGLLLQEESSTTETVEVYKPFREGMDGGDFTSTEKVVENPVVFITADTQFCPSQITTFYERADIIFHDCETAPYMSGVHAHYKELSGLDPEIKKKMWLYHYQPDTLRMFSPTDDGFPGFVEKGDVFSLQQKTSSDDTDWLRVSGTN